MKVAVGLRRVAAGKRTSGRRAAQIAVILSPPDVVEGMEKFLKDIASCYKVAET